jgi:Flp pilus assembly protein TadG
MKRWFRDEDGNSAVETALACTVLMTVFFGVIQMSWGLYAYHYTAEAARMATRYAMVRGSSCSSWASACPASSTDVQNYVKGLGFQGINASDLTVTTTWPTTGSACTPSSTPCNNPGNLVKVKVQYAIGFTIPYVPKINLNMSSTSQMVISQ